jgi:MFS family permease
MKKLIGYFADQGRATKLMIFATIVAALRFMLLHAVAIDFNLWPLFGAMEVMSGIAFAALEGVALAYVSRRWRRLRPSGPAEWLYWSILAAGQFVLLAAITWTTGMAFMAVRQGVVIDAVLPPAWAGLWSMAVAGINPLIVLLIGIVEDDDQIEADRDGGGLVIPVEVQAGVFLDQWERSEGREPAVPEMIHYFRESTGIELSIEDADRMILDWRSRTGKVGGRPKNWAKPLNGRK